MSSSAEGRPTPIAPTRARAPEATSTSDLAGRVVHVARPAPPSAAAATVLARAAAVQAQRRPTMSDYCMPILIINMGGEMVYILEQRLHAQNVPVDKSKRGRRRPIPGSAMRARLTVVHAARAVLQDVIRTMYNPKFLTELFRSQDVYSLASTRQIFDRLAHSSIMRLNQSSMDKLFDLMTMGFKYQLLVCTHPRELLHVTLNHLRQLRAKVEAPFRT